jgi:hypothetical protein
MDMLTAPSTLLNGLNWNNKDNYTLSDLEDIANKTGAYTNSSDELVAAAKWFVTHPEEFTKMEMNQANQQDDYFTKGNLDTYITNPNAKGEYDTKGNLNPEYM